MEFVVGMGEVGYSDVSGAVGYPVVRGTHRNYNCTHLRVNFTKQKADSQAIESNGVGCSRFIKPEIKSFAGKQGKNIVKEWIVIGKGHRRTDWYDKDMMLKALVLLCQLQFLARLLGKSHLRRRAIQRLDPQHYIRQILRSANS